MKNYFKVTLVIIKIAVILIFISTTAYSQLVEEVIYTPTIYPDQSAANVWVPVGNRSIMTFRQNDLYLDSISNQPVPNYMFFSRDTTAVNATDKIEIEAKLRLDAYDGSIDTGGCAMWVDDDTNGEVILFNIDGIQLFSRIGYTGQRLKYYMNTTDDYHVYRIVTEHNSLKVFVDNNPIPVIDTTFGQYWQPSRKIMFGDGSSVANAKSSWSYIKYKIERN